MAKHIQYVCIACVFVYLHRLAYEKTEREREREREGDSAAHNRSLQELPQADKGFGLVEIQGLRL